MAATDRPQCCWTHCENVQGAGTWTEINGETLPVCEEHWFGNLDKERRRLREAALDAVRYLTELGDSNVQAVCLHAFNHGMKYDGPTDMAMVRERLERALG